VVQEAFSAKELAPELQDLSFQELVDVMWSQSNFMSNLRITDHISNALDNPMHNIPLDSMIKILDKLANSEMYMVKHQGLFEKLARAVSKHKDLETIAVPIKARFLSKFA